ncbi:RNA polymerase subunit sigma-24 [Aeromicrobium sp. Root495]|uniref:RNA polymerase sigma factor SigJ n=1 Tax=Aeromicrobium sp. Root495 TaxID=1736550 RepID=UPI0006F88C60|nr:RNA polymerase sigma factor SigJ [Aeromicrobium sp. Root495]KQY59796.1 RNA polymerase subunit sigma-24 [Aeromicrobium sp. Root495]
MTEPVPSIGQALEERSRLLATAFRLLGTTAEAEDAVQEGYARWFRLSEQEQAEIRNPGAWLTTVVSRVCLDVLGSARARREQYVGPWLPEPRPSSMLPSASSPADPAERVTLDDEVTSAVMVVLDSLTPAERVAFVLHDVFGLTFAEVAQVVGRTPQACRTLASAARRDVRERRKREAATPADHHRVVEGFLAACATGDLLALLPLLDPDVTVSSDGGGVVRAARNAVHGADRVGRFVLGLLAKDPSLTFDDELVEGRTGLVLRRAGEVAAVVTFGIAADTVKDIWIVLNPAKLTAWR